jgi:hypothetical protein
VTLTDAAGSAATTNLTLTLDDTAPSAPVIASPASGTTTPDSSPTFTGTAEPGSAVTVSSSLNGTLGVVTADAAGDWSLVGAVLSTGTHAITAAATDDSGKTGAASAPVSITIGSPADTTPPGAPVIVSPPGGSTVTPTPILTGTAEPGSAVTVTSSVDGAIGVAGADAAGVWSLAAGISLTTGAHSLTATARDVAGNTSAASAPVAVTVVAPAAEGGGNTTINKKSNCGLTGAEVAIALGLVALRRRRRERAP